MSKRNEKTGCFALNKSRHISLSAIEHCYLQSSSRHLPSAQFTEYFYKETSRAKCASHLLANNNRAIMKSQRSLRVLAPARNEGGVRGHVGCPEKKNHFEPADFELSSRKCPKNGKDCLGQRAGKKSRKTVYYDGRNFIASVGPRRV